jgi:hypothetical protein
MHYLQGLNYQDSSILPFFSSLIFIFKQWEGEGTEPFPVTKMLLVTLGFVIATTITPFVLGAVRRRRCKAEEEEVRLAAPRGITFLSRFYVVTYFIDTQNRSCYAQSRRKEILIKIKPGGPVMTLPRFFIALSPESTVRKENYVK